MAINEEVQLGRAKNAVLSHFERTLSVPKIYIDADWNGSRVDVLAINRDGSGDVHAALLFSLAHLRNGDLDLVDSWERFDEIVETFNTLPAHYKWIVAVGGTQSGPGSFDVSNKRRDKMYAPDGLGRTGLLQVVFGAHEEPAAQVIVKAERFRARVSDLADNYIQAHTADWEIRA